MGNPNHIKIEEHKEIVKELCETIERLLNLPDFTGYEPSCESIRANELIQNEAQSILLKTKKREGF